MWGFPNLTTEKPRPKAPHVAKRTRHVAASEPQGRYLRRHVTDLNLIPTSVCGFRIGEIIAHLFGFNMLNNANNGILAALICSQGQPQKNMFFLLFAERPRSITAESYLRAKCCGLTCSGSRYSSSTHSDSWLCNHKDCDFGCQAFTT